MPTAILSTTAKAAERQRKKAAEKEKAAGGAPAAPPAADASKPAEGEAGLGAVPRMWGKQYHPYSALLSLPRLQPWPASPAQP